MVHSNMEDYLEDIFSLYFLLKMENWMEVGEGSTSKWDIYLIAVFCSEHMVRIKEKNPTNEDKHRIPTMIILFA